VASCYTQHTTGRLSDVLILAMFLDEARELLLLHFSSMSCLCVTPAPVFSAVFCFLNLLTTWMVHDIVRLSFAAIRDIGARCVKTRDASIL
jgi:hypothetical protein